MHLILEIWWYSIKFLLPCLSCSILLTVASLEFWSLLSVLHFLFPVAQYELEDDLNLMSIEIPYALSHLVTQKPENKYKELHVIVKRNVIPKMALFKTDQEQWLLREITQILTVQFWNSLLLLNMELDHLHAKFSQGTKNIWLHFMSLLMTQVVEILPHVIQGPTYSI